MRYKREMEQKIIDQTDRIDLEALESYKPYDNPIKNELKTNHYTYIYFLPLLNSPKL